MENVQSRDNHGTDNDDRRVGRVLTRREVLVLLAGAGAAVLVGCDTPNSNSAQPTAAPINLPTSTAATTNSGAATQTPLNAEGAAAASATRVPETPTAETAASANGTASPDCVVKPELTEGPYFKDEKINRSDIRSDTSTGAVKPGVPLVLAFTLSSITGGTCTPLKEAQIDIWHCDAAGIYSDTTDPNWGSTVGQNFLRGYQVTDANGKAQFTTIYPGWYNGRAVHIHFKVRTTGTNRQSYEFTSQFFFDDAFTDQIYARQPYSARGQRTLRNAGDNIYQSGGSQLVLAPTKRGEGYTAPFSMGLDLSDTKVGASDSNSAGGGPGGPGGPPPPGRGVTPAP